MTDGRDLFALNGMADIALKGKVDASVFRTPIKMQIGQVVSDIMRKSPHALERQLLLGEPVQVLDPASLNPVCRSDYSGYVGFTGQNALAQWVKPTHIVTQPSSFLFAENNFKSRHPQWISMGSVLTLVGETDRFFETHLGSFVPKSHVTPLDHTLEDPLGHLDALLGVPYLWGGNSAAGIDCSGLVQMMMRLAQRPCPGDSDQQAGTLGHPIDRDAEVKPGDLWFWKGHVAISRNKDQLIHANAHHMCVALEPLDQAIARISDQGDGPVTIRRRVF